VTKVKNNVLDYLTKHADSYVSGAVIADDLGVSRNAVWKAIQQLNEQGFNIESSHRVGYRYVGSNVLSETLIKHGLDSELEIHVFQTIDSTNKYAKELAMKNPSTPIAIVANEQTAGYGRQGREYYSPANDGLYLSLLLPIHGQELNGGLLTTGVATVIASVLAELYGVQPEIKWVNDIIVNHHKVSGIMTEGIADIESGTLSYVIIGIGLNLTNEAFPETIANKAGSLGLDNVDRNELVSALLNGLLQLATTYQTADFMAQYRKLSLVIGKQVTVNRYGSEITGLVSDIADDGALVLVTPNGEEQYTSGEITKVNLIDGEYHG
jgi:BirA family biotin operon repressor/biotin-[acetyl-CoA-carboxylase] ligase